jgi:DNA (cytosine-5)-methyltransferase 1
VKLLDLFCGQGGCSVGYHRAGFDVTGVDVADHGHRYPYRFVNLPWDEVSFDGFDVVHASPPCQAYSITKHTHTKDHPDLLAPVRDALIAWGGPYVIENVPGAPMVNPITLCGAQHKAPDHYTGRTVRLRRHRLFESNMPLMAEPCSCDNTLVGGVYGGAWSKNKTIDPTVKRTGGYAPPDDVQRELMGLHYMTRDGLNQAIPPAYTELIGAQLMDLLTQGSRPAPILADGLRGG